MPEKRTEDHTLRRIRSGTEASSIDSCCRMSRRPLKEPMNCSECGVRGSDLGEITLKALLRPAALERRSEERHRFCATPSCPVVHYGREETFTRDDVIVPVFQKETAAGRTVCYCFAVSQSDITEEVATTGRSTASIRIKALVQADRCACELRNPQGSCCLGNVAATEHQALTPRGLARSR